MKRFPVFCLPQRIVSRIGMVIRVGLLVLVAMFFCCGVSGQDRPMKTLEPGEVYPFIEEAYALYARTKNAVTATRDTDCLYQKKTTVHVIHTAKTDWAIRSAKAIPANPGDIVEISTVVLNRGPRMAGPSATLYKKDGQSAVAWTYGQRLTGPNKDWTRLVSRFVVPPETASVMPRIVGSGECELYLADCTVTIKERVEPSLTSSNPTLENSYIKVSYSCQTGCFDVQDKRTGRLWKQYAGDGTSFVTNVEKEKNGFVATFFDNNTSQEYRARLTLLPDKPELAVQLEAPAAASFSEPIFWPAPFKSRQGDRLVFPLGEGMSFPVDEPNTGISTVAAYTGHGLVMAFWGHMEDTTSAGYMTILDTPDDAELRFKRTASDAKESDKLLLACPVWIPQKLRFGYARALRYVFFDRGGHVAMCKRYLEHVKQLGLYVPFTEKIKRNPELAEGLKRLRGAANIWAFGPRNDNVAMARRMKAAGLDRFLWSAGGSAYSITQLNAMDGVLTSRYDCYKDIVNPSDLETLGQKATLLQRAWPNDLNWSAADGTLLKGWAMTPKDKTKPRIDSGSLCDTKTPDYAREKIGNELKTIPYRARFIDCTMASSWYECWNPAHPMTRSDSKRWRVKLLELVRNDFRLVCGSENGHEISVPTCDFFEGMMSLGPYRVPDSGRNIQQIWDEVPERTAKFQVAPEYRLPLWELVFHDCTVSYWYWGDYNNKLPALWRKRDLFNALYGVPPMYIFDKSLWDKNRDRFVASYKTAQPVSELTGWSAMTDHRILSKDRLVQQTCFANGVTVTVNFGKQPFVMPDGYKLAGDDLRIEQ